MTADSGEPQASTPKAPVALGPCRWAQDDFQTLQGLPPINTKWKVLSLVTGRAVPRGKVPSVDQAQMQTDSSVRKVIVPPWRRKLGSELSRVRSKAREARVQTGTRRAGPQPKLLVTASS